MSIISEAKETLLPWKKEFFKNISIFESLGLPKQKAQEFLSKFLRLVNEVGTPKVLNILSDISQLPKLGTYTAYKPDIRSFMISFLSPFLSKFELKGEENLQTLASLTGKFPVTIVANHLSHFDAGVLFIVLYKKGGLARQLAENMVFIAGRPVFQTHVTRVALGMLNSLLVCSRKDLVENVGAADVMTKVNMRSFRHSSKLQKEGKIIVVFPEGTRSRTGQLLKFVDAVYHYVTNKIVIPISLVGTDKVLPTNSFVFNSAPGSITIEKPVFISGSEESVPSDLPESIHRIFPPKNTNKKTYCLDSLAMLIGKNLDVHQHGTYRNLYRDDINLDKKNLLIQTTSDPAQSIVFIGHSNFSTAIASVLANKPDTNIKIFIPDKEKAESFNADQYDLEYYPFFKLPPNIKFTSDTSVVGEGTIFIQGVHPWALDSYYNVLAPILKETKGPIINIMKGFTKSKHRLILTDLEKTYGLKRSRLAVLAGSNYPDQIMERKITGFELAVVDSNLTKDFIELLNTGYIFTNQALVPDDIEGIQIAGALRTIYAMFIGMLDAYYELKLGGNNDSTLFHISNQIFKELVDVGVVLGGKRETFYGLSGLTDLMLTCFGTDTRDRHYGHETIFGRANPFKQSSGIANLQALMHLMEINSKKYPILWVIIQVIIEKKDINAIFNQTSFLFRK